MGVRGYNIAVRECWSRRDYLSQMPVRATNLVILTALSLVPWQTSQANSCLQYEVVTLTGTVIRHVYPGPPDYESVSKGDEPRTIWVLLLDYGICVVDSDPRYPREYYEREVQLLWGSGHYKQHTHLLGKKVIASGELQHGGGKYDKPLVLIVEEMTRTSK